MSQPMGTGESGRDPHESATSEPTYVVGIGASAGGLEALEQFFSSVPARTGACFVVIQHLSPDYKSLMVELLGKRAAMPIRLAEDGIELEANTTYVIPPGKDITVTGLRLNVTDQAQQRTPHLPVDRFLISLAHEMANRSIAVILSGTGSDGARGVREVKSAGGMIVVQTSESAKFDGMPARAADTGLADYVLDPDQMGPTIVDYLARTHDEPVEEPESLLSDEETKLRIFARIRERHKVDFTYYRMSTVLRRIQRRMGINRVSSVGEYARLLDEDSTEVDTLYRELLIGVTGFFRDRDAFEQLAAYWKKRLADNPEASEIRCWVAGCSTGEEAYSVVITLLEAVREARSSAMVKVFATDIDQNALAKAAAGRYPESIAADVDHELLARYFVRKNQDFQVTRAVRERVVFAQHNLVHDPPFTNIDLVSCRNLLIYLQPVLQRRVLEHLNFSLSPGGILFLGSSETIGEMLDYYEPLNHKWKIYRSRGSRVVPSPGPVALRTERAAPQPQASSDPRPNRPGGEEQTLSRFVEAVGQDYLPLVLISDESLQLVHLIGDPGDYLRIPAGRTTVSVTKLIAKDLAMPVSTGLQKVFGGETEVRYTNVRFHVDDATRLCHIRLRRLPDVRGQDPLAAVVITNDSGKANERVEDSQALTFDVESEQNRLIDDLQQELQFTRENLQATIEELETANEELQATNEELMASNEELQSTNEELQSVNEELHSVNSEYQEKIMELTELNNDLENLFDNTDAAMLFLDENLIVRRMNDRMKSVAVLSGDPVGSPFTPDCLQLVGVDLESRIRAANEANERWEAPVQAEDGRWYLMRLRPYQLALEIYAGVTLTLVDISALVEAQREVAAQRERYAQLVNKLNDGVVVYRVTNAGVLVDELNEAALRMGGIEHVPAAPTPVEAIWPNVETFGIPEAVREAANTGESQTIGPQLYADEQVQVWVQSRFYRIDDGHVVGVFTDVSEETRLHHMLRAAGLAWWEWDVDAGTVTASELKSELIGMTPDEVGPELRAWTDRIHPDDVERVNESVRRVLRGEDDRFDHRYRLRTKSGAYRRLRDVGSVIARTPTGTPKRLVGWVEAVDEGDLTDDE